jgi:hypothetical protein
VALVRTRRYEPALDDPDAPAGYGRRILENIEANPRTRCRINLLRIAGNVKGSRATCDCPGEEASS